MVRKVYSYPGIASGDIQIKVGRAYIKISFVNGYLDKKMSRPATYSTADPVMQHIIENSDLFNHRIFLFRVYGAPEPATAPAPAPSSAPEPEEAASREVTEYPEVTTFEEAVRVLKSIPGVKVTSLRSPASAKKVADTYAVVFPNYNYE